MSLKRESTSLRVIAARIINDITHGRSLRDRLEDELPSIKDERDRSFLKNICYGICRLYPRLIFILHHLLKKPLKAKDSDVQSLLLVGLYQLMMMRIPPYASISETVNATLGLHKAWAKGLVNATLREYLRKKDELDKKLMTDVEALYAHPAWWIDATQRDWPNHWEEILKANNEHPPFSLRIDLSHLSREKYLEKLSANKISAKVLSETTSGIILDQPVPVLALPGFSQGDVSVQDGAAQLAAGLLDLKPNLRVLDACAAPGGKLIHILETEHKLQELIGIEKKPERLLALKESVMRACGDMTSSTISLICHDAKEVSKWWDGKLFDRILIDAPCSGSGVIRRHPDIKLLRKESDIEAYGKEQRGLLSALWPLLCHQGRLVYATCSIFPEENECVVKQFLIDHPDAKEIKIKSDWGQTREIGKQILPGMHQMDGFYYAIICKE
jgi:16S rRNA (cytosine967-C5)-methyltransferase